MKYIKLFDQYNTDESDDIIELAIPTEKWLGLVLDKMDIPYNKIVPINQGGYGIAFDLGNNTVIKITTDTSEAYYSNKLINISSQNLVRTFDVANIKSSYQYGELYVIHMEKLNTNISNSIKHMIDYLHKSNFIIRNVENGIKVSDDEVYNFFKDKLLSFDRNKIIYLFNKWMNVYNECLRYDIPFDDFHSKNVGIREIGSDEFVFFDISCIHQIRAISTDDIKIIDIK